MYSSQYTPPGKVTRDDAYMIRQAALRCHIFPAAAAAGAKAAINGLFYIKYGGASGQACSQEYYERGGMMAIEREILSSSDIERIISDTASRVVRDFPDMESFAIVGIQTRGVELAARIKEKIEKLTGKSVKNGTLDITFHRDDIITRGKLPVLKETLIEFDINNKIILLVDDVLFTGRTTKAAIETLMAFGRPDMIRFFVLVDRGGRELPIQADYCGHKVLTVAEDLVKVRLRDTDDVEDSVVIVTEK